jgi:Cys-rich protein (TIGR01571 family)
MSALQINLDQQGDPQEVSPQQIQQIMLVFTASIAVYFIGNIVAICLYKVKVHDEKPKLQDGNQTMASGQWHYGLFDCFSNTNECMCSLCCITTRYADTHSAISGSFWGSFCYFTMVNILISVVAAFISNAMYPIPHDLAASFQHGQFVPGSDPQQEMRSQVSSLIELALRGVAFGVVARKQLRTKLGDPNPGAGWVNDFLAWGLCPCCALTQESVEADIAVDVSISCPFTLTKGRQVRAREVAPSDYEKLLGDAVLLETGR